MAWLVGGGIVLYYIVPCRPNVVNTAERTVTRNCITFATISFLFISVVCFVLWFIIIYPSLMAAPVPSPAPSGRPFPCASLFSGWCQQSPYSRPFPLCQPVFRLVSAITPR